MVHRREVDDPRAAAKTAAYKRQQTIMENMFNQLVDGVFDLRIAFKERGVTDMQLIELRIKRDSRPGGGFLGIAKVRQDGHNLVGFRSGDDPVEVISKVGDMVANNQLKLREDKPFQPTLPGVASGDVGRESDQGKGKASKGK